MAFGGPVGVDALRITHLIGERTGSLANLAVRRGAGAGGKCWRAGQLTTVDDYSSARTISHDYDVEVASEGLRAVVAAPVMHGRQVCGVLYAGVRDIDRSGDRLRDLTAHVARTLAVDLEVADQVSRRTRLQEQEINRLREQVRALHAGLREVRGRIDDSVLKASIERMLDDDTPGADVVLNPREIDVLALAAEGLTYPEIAARLALAPLTVKSYMRNVNQRLGTSSRHQAVVSARRLGILP